MAYKLPDHTLLRDGTLPVLPFNILPYDTDHPKSLYNLVPDSIKTCIQNLDPKFYKWSEVQLRKYCKPSPELGRLRLQFWDEYTTAQDNNRKMNMEWVIRNIYPSMELFYDCILTDEFKYGYMLRPPKDYFIAQREMLELGWEKLRAVLEEDFIQEVPIKDGKGKILLNDDGEPTYIKKVDHQLISKMIAITQMLDIRVKGAIVQKMQLESKSLNVNIGNTTPQMADQTMEQLEAMERKLKSIQQQIVDVELLDAAKEESPSTK